MHIHKISENMLDYERNKNAEVQKEKGHMGWNLLVFCLKKPSRKMRLEASCDAPTVTSADNQGTSQTPLSQNRNSSLIEAVGHALAGSDLLMSHPFLKLPLSACRVHAGKRNKEVLTIVKK